MATFGKVNRSASFNPTSAFPLDARYYFDSLAAAEAAAKAAVEVGSADGTYYYGENIVVVTENDATLYVIKPDKTLKQVGGTDNADVLKDITQDDISGWDTAAEFFANDTPIGTNSEAWQDVTDRLETAEEAIDELGKKIDEIPEIPEQIDYSVTIAESSPEGYATAYTFAQNGKTIGTINIPKDMVVESGSVVTDPEGQTAGTYIKLVLANANEDELYINVSDLIEYITGGTATDGMITVTVDPTTHVATATINDGTITLAKLATDVQTAIGKAHAHENETVLNAITEDKVSAWDSALMQLVGIDAGEGTVKSYVDLAIEANTHEHKNDAVLNAITEDKVAAWDAAEPNAIASVDTTQFALDADKNLTLLDIAMGKVTGLTEALAGKVDVMDGYRLISKDEATKLEKLVIGEDGSVEISGTIAAGNVDGLENWITVRAGTLEGLSENNFSDSLLAKLEGIAENAEVNYVKSVSDEFTVSNLGELSVNSINVNKLTQTEGETLILNGGASAI